jgi:hypothetical protein
MDSLKGHTLTPVQLVTIAKEDDFNCVTIESLLRSWDTISLLFNNTIVIDGKSITLPTYEEVWGK